MSFSLRIELAALSWETQNEAFFVFHQYPVAASSFISNLLLKNIILPLFSFWECIYATMCRFNIILKVLIRLNVHNPQECLLTYIKEKLDLCQIKTLLVKTRFFSELHHDNFLFWPTQPKLFFRLHEINFYILLRNGISSFHIMQLFLKQRSSSFKENIWNYFFLVVKPTEAVVFLLVLDKATGENKSIEKMSILPCHHASML